MNAFEIEQIERDVRANFELPLSYQGWADIERRAREERARVIGQGFSQGFRALAKWLTSFGRQVRSTGTHCADARLRHS